MKWRMILKTFDKMKKKINKEYVLSYVFHKRRTSTYFDFNVIYAIGRIL